MSGPPPPGYYPPPPHGQPGQHPPAPPGQVYPQGVVPPPYGPPSGCYPGVPPPAYAGGPTQAAYPPAHAPPPGGFYACPPGGAFPPPGSAFPGPHPGAVPPYAASHPWGHQPPIGAGHVPPYQAPHHPSGQKHVDVESDDSDPSGYSLYSKEDKHPLTVRFTNKTGKKVQMFWINKKGRRKRKGKIKPGHSKSIDTFETHVFMALNRKLSSEPLLINGTPVFYAFPYNQGDQHVEVEIRKPTASSVNNLKSDAHVTIPVEVKFVNRTKREVQLEWITPQGRREKKKVLPRGRCWRTTSWEGHYWVCCDPKHDQHLFGLNYGLHYKVHRTRRLRERVVITADMKISGSSSSSSSSSSG
ncbi:uncharacterized protein LOC141875770 [Acropora palmata]|uniref:uncharacterized protein LOC141875770 n=1 Tax=Acropora palmata TaxID=6131 RepID=UPI003D9FD4A8